MTHGARTAGQRGWFGNRSRCWAVTLGVPRFLALTSSLALLLAACSSPEAHGEVTGPLMRPGQDCLSCHSDGAGRGAPTWTAAGTVYAAVDANPESGVPRVDVLLKTAQGALIERLVTNTVGNFYTATPLPIGFRVGLEYQGESIEMPCAPPAGLCNACHNVPPIGAAPGRIYVPQGRDPARPPFDCSHF